MRNGVPRKPFYLTGRIGDQSISLHAEGEKVVERLLESQLEIGSLVLPPEGLVKLQRALLARAGGPGARPAVPGL